MDSDYYGIYVGCTPITDVKRRISAIFTARWTNVGKIDALCIGR